MFRNEGARRTKNNHAATSRVAFEAEFLPIALTFVVTTNQKALYKRTAVSHRRLSMPAFRVLMVASLHRIASTEHFAARPERTRACNLAFASAICHNVTGCASVNVRTPLSRS